MELSDYFSGKKIFGDDFSRREIELWYRDESEGYADLGAADSAQYAYGYHALNYLHGFRFLPDQPWASVLSFGGAYGHELLPIVDNISSITIVEPSDSLISERLGQIKPVYVKPDITGNLPFASDSFDLITCFGVLHHIPNVSHVISELGRCLAPGGYALIREPIISMGDWRHPRRGLTKRERGIPRKLLKERFLSSGLSIISEKLCDFPGTSILVGLTSHQVFNSRFLTRIDHVLSTLFAWNISYHATSKLRKIRPRDVSLVLRKRTR
jgi:SAM-dependent methyltransferase